MDPKTIINTLISSLLISIYGCNPELKRLEEKREDGSYIVYHERAGVTEGLYQSYDSKHRLETEVLFKNGKKDGDKKYYDSLGNIRAIELYDNGLLVHHTQFHENGNVQVSASKKAEKLDGPYYQFSNDYDTIVTAFYRSDTAIYVKAFDHDDPKLVLEYFVNYQVETKELNADSMEVEFYFPSPDPNLKWAFALGRFTQDEINNDEFEKNRVEIDFVEINRGSFVINRSSLIEGRLYGIIIEYDKIRNATFLTHINEEI